MSIGEFFSIKKELWLDQLSTLRHDYPKSLRFALADLLLGFFSLFFNPYRLCRKQGEIYGETPIQTLKAIVRECHLTPQDTWLELGSGRGKNCLWIASRIGCKTLGIEKIPLLAYTARLIARLTRLPAAFSRADFYVSLPQATVVYIYSTCLTDAETARLSALLRALPKPPRVVTISAPLDGWSSRPFPVSFPWGTTFAYLNSLSVIKSGI